MNNITFKELNLSSEINKALDSMGFEEATPIQTQSIPEIMEGNDVIGLAQTGTGKTYAFGIPAIEKLDIKKDNVQVLVLSPTRELTIQTCEGLKQLVKYKEDVKVVSIYGGQQIERQITALKKKPQIVVGTPGRIMDHLRRKTLKLDNISMLVLDEADEMLNMGFREDIDEILKKTNDNKQIVLFSATMSKGIMNITTKYQRKDAKVIKIEHSQIVAPKIEQYYIETSNSNKPDVLVRLLDSMNIKLGVVFCNTKMKVEELTIHLQACGYMVEALHGDIKQTQRDNIMKRFRNKEIDILVATDVAARGIDVDDVELVVNYDIPSDEEYYVHRIGRTGRAGRVGKAYTLVSAKEMYKLRDIQRYTKANIVLEKVPSFEAVLEKKVVQKIEKIKEEYVKGDFSKYTDIIQKITQENGDIQTIDIAAILLKMEFDKKVKKIDEGKKGSNITSRRLSENITRVFVNMGKLDGFDNTKMKKLFVEDMQIPKDSVTGIKILDKFSFVNIDENYIDSVIKKQANKKFNGRILSIEISDSSSENGFKKSKKTSRKRR